MARLALPRISLRRRKVSPLLAAALRRLFRTHPGWAVDAHNTQSLLWCLVAGAGRGGVRPVATVHGEYGKSESSWLRSSLHEQVLRLCRRAGWNFIAVSDSVERYLRRLGASAGHVTTAWSAVEKAPGFTPAEATELRGALGLAPDDFVVITVGRLVPVKNQRLLLAAVAQLREAVPRLRVIFAGDGPELPALRRYARELEVDDRVRFLGRRDDVANLLFASDVCALTSTSEGLPYALLEAAAASTPIVSTRVGSIGSIFTDGYSAMLLDEAEAEDVAGALRFAAEHPAEMARMAGQARLDVLSSLSLPTMVATALSVYTGGSSSGAAA